MSEEVTNKNGAGETSLAARGARAVAPKDWHKQVAAALQAGEIERIRDIPGIRIEAFGGELVWAHPIPGTQIAANVVGWTPREREDPKTGEITNGTDYVLELISLPTALFVRGSADPDPKEYEVFEMPDRVGTIKKYRKAMVGEIISLSEVYNLRKLKELVGFEVFINYRKQVGIGGGHSVWRIDLLSNRTSITENTTLVA